MHIRICSLMITLAFVSACSAGPTRQVRQDAVMSGAQTAETAADAAREAEAKDATGLIYATSSAGPPPEPTAALPGEPAAPVAIVLPDATVILLHGEPITEAELIAWVRERRAMHPELPITIEVAQGVPPARVEALTAKLKDAGATDVRRQPQAENPTTPPTLEEPTTESPGGDPAPDSPPLPPAE